MFSPFFSEGDNICELLFDFQNKNNPIKLCILFRVKHFFYRRTFLELILGPDWGGQLNEYTIVASSENRTWPNL